MGDIFYNRTITVFNKFNSEEILNDDEWYATVLHNVRVVETQGRNISTSGLTDADSVKVHVMLDRLEKPYMSPIEWNKLEDKRTAFTLTQGRDFIVLGDASDLDTLVAPDLFQYIKENYDGVFRVTNVDKFTIIPHLEIGGR